MFTSGGLAGGLLGGHTNVTLGGRLVVFGIEGLPEDLWSFAMYLIAGCVWQQVRQRPNRQRLLVVDEAWLLLQHRDGGRFLESIVRLARSYGLGLVFITQDVKNVLQDPRGSVIADNVFTTLLLRQSGKGQQQTTQTQQLVAEQFGLSGEEQRMLASAQTGHGLLLVGPWRVHLHVIASKAEERIAMTAPRERQALAAAAVKLAYPLLDVVERAGVRLNRSGANRLQGKCPFHEDRTPSFFVYIDRQRFMCYGCKVWGDVLDFVRLHGAPGHCQRSLRLAHRHSATATEEGLDDVGRDGPTRASLGSAHARAAAGDEYGRCAVSRWLGAQPRRSGLPARTKPARLGRSSVRPRLCRRSLSRGSSTQARRPAHGRGPGTAASAGSWRRGTAFARTLRRPGGHSRDPGWTAHLVYWKEAG